MAASQHRALAPVEHDPVLGRGAWVGTCTNGMPVKVPADTMEGLRQRAERNEDGPTRQLLTDPDVWHALMRAWQDTGRTNMPPGERQPDKWVLFVPPSPETMCQLFEGMAHPELWRDPLAPTS